MMSPLKQYRLLREPLCNPLYLQSPDREGGVDRELCKTLINLPELCG